MVSVAVEAEHAQLDEIHPRSVWRVGVALFVVSLLVTAVALSMWRPATYPRLKLLPQPAFTEFEDDCGRGVLRGWEKGAVFWVHEDFVDAVPCPGTTITDP